MTTNPEEMLAKSNAAAEFETEAAGEAATQAEEVKEEALKVEVGPEHPVVAPETPAAIVQAPAAVAPVAPSVIPPVIPAATEEEKKLEAGFTENVASVLDQPIEAPKTVLPPPSAPVQPAPVQEIPVQFEEKKTV